MDAGKAVWHLRSVLLWYVYEPRPPGPPGSLRWASRIEAAPMPRALLGGERDDVRPTINVAGAFASLWLIEARGISPMASDPLAAIGFAPS